MLTAWIALDDADSENGALRYRSGSHINGVVPHTRAPHNIVTITEETAGPHEEVVAAVERGGVVFHHGAAMHSSGSNTSGRQRRAYGVHYLRRGARFWQDAGPLQNVRNPPSNASVSSEPGVASGDQGGLDLGRLISVTEGTADQLEPLVAEEPGRIAVADGVTGLKDHCRRSPAL